MADPMAMAGIEAEVIGSASRIHERSFDWNAAVVVAAEQEIWIDRLPQVHSRRRQALLSWVCLWASATRGSGLSRSSMLPTGPRATPRLNQETPSPTVLASR